MNENSIVKCLDDVCFHVFADGVPIDRKRWRQHVPFVGNEKETVLF
jgi:hypothetical protein